MVVADDVGMAKRGEDGELGMKLLSLLLGHLQVADLLSTDNGIICLATNLADDTKGAMSWIEKRSASQTARKVKML